MTDITPQMLDAEKNLSDAIDRINKGIKEIEKFKSASDTLQDTSEKLESLFASLADVSEILKIGAERLNSQGIVEFKELLASEMEELHSAVELQAKSLKTVLVASGVLNIGLAAFIIFKVW